MSEQREISIHVPVLARVEGDGALDIEVREGRIERLQLRIFEPPRLFEKFIEGRSYAEVPDLVARICGICPVAYQMSAVQALEGIFGCDAGPWVQAMRRVIYCGEWIESHALHIHLLAAPDYLGFKSVIDMAQQYPNEVNRGLRLQALGNAMIRMFGGRSVHPVGVRVGGFHHAPREADVEAMCAQLRAALPEAEALVRWAAALPLPDDAQCFTSVALRHPDEYPMFSGRIVSDQGHDFALPEFEQRVREFQVPYSTALHALLDGQPYLVGPLARLNLNLDRLPAPVRTVLDETGIGFPSANMYHSIVARAVEIYTALWEALRLLEQYRYPHTSYADIELRAGVGFGCTEAPRGILWHRYQSDAQGMIRACRIVPPTNQNQARIEEDLRNSLQSYGFQRSDAELRLRAETVVRNYDPCISCSTHFLQLKIDRR